MYISTGGGFPHMGEFGITRGELNNEQYLKKYYMLFLSDIFDKFKQIKIIFCNTKLCVWGNGNIYCGDM